MIQKNLFLVEIIHEYESPYQTADLKVIGYGNDRHEYALKRLEDAPLLPATEWVCHSLCRAIGIPTPDFAAVRRLAAGDIAFGSRIDKTLVQVVNPHAKGAEPIEVTIAKLFSQSITAQSQILGLDATVGNVDRHCRNFLFRKTSSGTHIPLAFDFSQAWVAKKQPFGSTPWPSDSGSAKMSKYLNDLGKFDASAARATIERLCALPEHVLQDALNSCDPSWVHEHNWEPTLDAWAQRHNHIKPMAKQNFADMP